MRNEAQSGHRLSFPMVRPPPLSRGCNPVPHQPAIIPLARRRMPTGGGLYAVATLPFISVKPTAHAFPHPRPSRRLLPSCLPLQQVAPPASLPACLPARFLFGSVQGLFYTVWPVAEHMYPKLRLKYRPSLISLAGGMQSLPVTQPEARATPTPVSDVAWLGEL